MTLPTVVQKYKQKEALVRLEKAYSTISQAFLAAQAKHGEAKDWAEWDDAHFILEKYIAPEIKGSKVYPPNGVVRAMCFEGKFVGGHLSQDFDYSTQYAWLTKVHMSTPFSTATASIKLPDGTCVGFNGISDSVEDRYKNYVYIDVNSPYRLPNMAGKDLFFFQVVGNSIRPVGYDWDPVTLASASTIGSCHGNANSGGRVCAAKIIADGWQMKEDYPW